MADKTLAEILGSRPYEILPSRHVSISVEDFKAIMGTLLDFASSKDEISERLRNDLLNALSDTSLTAREAIERLDEVKEGYRLGVNLSETLRVITLDEQLSNKKG